MHDDDDDTVKTNRFYTASAVIHFHLIDTMLLTPSVIIASNIRRATCCLSCPTVTQLTLNTNTAVVCTCIYTDLSSLHCDCDCQWLIDELCVCVV